MAQKFVYLLLATLVMTTAARSESWKATLTPDNENSAGICYGRTTNTTAYLLSLTNGMLIGRNEIADQFKVRVADDGAVDSYFTTTNLPMAISESMPRMRVYGNARTKDLRLSYDKYACRWKLLPAK